MARNLVIFFLISSLQLLSGSVSGQSVPQGHFLIRNTNALMADKGEVASFGHECLQKQYRDRIRQSQSIETLIEIVERLEENLANSTDAILSRFSTPDKVARLLLHRFHIDDIDFNVMDQQTHTQHLATINTAILGKMADVPTQYYFPDYIFTDDEKCSLVWMFSHIYLNNSASAFRRKRATYNIPRSNQVTSNYNNNNNKNNNIGVQPTVNPFVNPIQEKGVVTLRQDRVESISPALVLYGVVAGLTTSPVVDGKSIAKSNDDRLQGVALKDHVLAVTLASLQGSAILSQISMKLDEKLIFGAAGTWQNSTCCTYYALDGVESKSKLEFSSRGSLAQIRGALDGYVIGNYLKNVAVKPTKLSTILKSYYSRPHITSGDFVSYCDRTTRKPSTTDLADVSNAYRTIYSVVSSDNFEWLNNAFTSALDKAASVQNKICNEARPSTNLDKSSPSETPADIIFVVDPKSQFLERTLSIISEISSRVHRVSKYSGRVSVFANTMSRSNVELPGSSGGWPLSAWIYNSSSLGSVMCQIVPDYNTNLMGNENLGKYLHSVNQTISNYKWWTWRRFSQASASINVVMFDYDTLKMPSSGKDKDEYYDYRDSLRYRNRDVRFLVLSNNQKDFKDILRYPDDLVGYGQDYTSIGTSFANKIMETPATITCNNCYEDESKDFLVEGFITPGYKQNWAVYPEYFTRSSKISFRIKAVAGPIKYCYDRKFPAERAEQCKDLAAGGEDEFDYWNPCDGKTVHSCDPLYITVWGKENQGMCNDEKCETLDQIKFQIYHTGLRSSALSHLLSPFFIVLASLLYLVFNQN